MYKFLHEYMRAQLLQSRLTLCDPMDYSFQGPLSMGFSRQEYWSGLLFPSPGDPPNPGLKATSLVSPALAGGLFTTQPPRSTNTTTCILEDTSLKQLLLYLHQVLCCLFLILKD